MYCLHCGTASQEPLCENCRTQEILEEIFYGILHYQAETCENGALRTYVESFDPPAKARSCFPELFALLDEKAAEFCRSIITGGFMTRILKGKQLNIFLVAGHGLAQAADSA